MRYTNVKVNISEGQKEKLQHAIKAGCPAVSIRLGHEDLEGDDISAVTDSQVRKLAKALENGRVITIRMSSKQRGRVSISRKEDVFPKWKRMDPDYTKSSTKVKDYSLTMMELYDGKGLLLGPKSPFANIPIFGAIL